MFTFQKDGKGLAGPSEGTQETAGSLSRGLARTLARDLRKGRARGLASPRARGLARNRKVGLAKGRTRARARARARPEQRGSPPTAIGAARGHREGPVQKALARDELRPFSRSLERTLARHLCGEGPLKEALRVKVASARALPFGFSRTGTRPSQTRGPIRHPMREPYWRIPGCVPHGGWAGVGKPGVLYFDSV